MQDSALVCKIFHKHTMAKKNNLKKNQHTQLDYQVPKTTPEYLHETIRQEISRVSISDISYFMQPFYKWLQDTAATY